MLKAALRESVIETSQRLYGLFWSPLDRKDSLLAVLLVIILCRGVLYVPACVLVLDETALEALSPLMGILNVAAGFSLILFFVVLYITLLCRRLQGVGLRFPFMGWALLLVMPLVYFGVGGVSVLRLTFAPVPLLAQTLPFILLLPFPFRPNKGAVWGGLARRKKTRLPRS